MHAASLRHKVIFFRDQHLSPESRGRLAWLFGELETHPLRPSAPGYPLWMFVLRLCWLLAWGCCWLRDEGPLRKGRPIDSAL
ncbi:TauD/TfdA family dioxygenase [Erythrobacter colymbi]|uniref:TauD/TfdA family dioxygenase n=1 Tax=Erythrobacter colymbi TaxID=1161202 RepID=UPI00117C78EE